LSDTGYVMPYPGHDTAWESHLKIAHCVALRAPDRRAGRFEEIHEQLHASPLAGTIPHTHSHPKDWDVQGEEHGFW
jgi:hypothetical protein